MRKTLSLGILLLLFRLFESFSQDLLYKLFQKPEITFSVYSCCLYFVTAYSLNIGCISPERFQLLLLFPQLASLHSRVSIFSPLLFLLWLTGCSFEMNCNILLQRASLQFEMMQPGNKIRRFKFKICTVTALECFAAFLEQISITRL